MMDYTRRVKIKKIIKVLVEKIKRVVIDIIWIGIIVLMFWFLLTN